MARALARRPAAISTERSPEGLVRRRVGKGWRGSAAGSSRGSAAGLTRRAAAGLSALALCVGCGGAGASDATKNRTFYDWSLGDGAQAFESAYPRLDWPENTDSPRFVGVSVLEGRVQFSRPRSWRIRNASNRPGEPYIHYVSPNAYSFAIYQRKDPPGDPWKDIVGRYSADVESVGAKIVGRLVPVATSNGQGRAFTIERDVEAAKRPLESKSREILLRSGKMVALVQIVHQEQTLEAVDDELLRAVATLHLP